MIRVLVAGATGNVGRLVLKRAKEKGHWLRAFVRSSSKAKNLGLYADDLVVGDATRLETFEDALDGIDVVISCIGASVSMTSAQRLGYSQLDLPANANLIRLAQRKGVRRFNYLSTFSSRGIADCAYVRAHKAVSDLLLASGLSATIVRPTGLFSVFAELMATGRLGFLPLFGDGSAKTNPVHQAEVAQILVDCIEGGPEKIDVGGPEVLSRREILEMVLRVSGKTPHLVRVPEWLLSAGATMNGIWNPRLGELLEFGLKVSTNDCVAPVGGKERLVDYLRNVAR